MAHKYFNEDHAQSPERKLHMTVMDGDKPVNLPIVKGVISIPDTLHDKVTMGPGWVKYTGQVPSSVEELQPFEDVDAYHNGAKKAAK